MSVLFCRRYDGKQLWAQMLNMTAWPQRVLEMPGLLQHPPGMRWDGGTGLVSGGKGAAGFQLEQRCRGQSVSGFCGGFTEDSAILLRRLKTHAGVTSGREPSRLRGPDVLVGSLR